MLHKINFVHKKTIVFQIYIGKRTDNYQTCVQLFPLILPKTGIKNYYIEGRCSVTSFDLFVVSIHLLQKQYLIIDI